MFNLFIKKEKNKVLSTIIIIIFLFPLSSLTLVTSMTPITIIQAETLTNQTFAEPASSNKVSPSTATTLVDANISETAKKNTTQIMNFGNSYDKMIEIESASGDKAISKIQNKNGTTFPFNITDAIGITGSSTNTAGQSSEVTADFNGDNFEDKAIGVPYEDINDVNGNLVENAGAVHIIYGSATGLSATTVLPDQLWTPNLVENNAEINDNFGRSMSAGDYNNDGFDDLVVGTPWEDISVGFPPGLINAGALTVIYGSASGLSFTPEPVPPFWIQGFGFLKDVAEHNDLFGMSLSSGDYNGDGRDDLAVGVLFEDIGFKVSAGAVHIIYGSASGLSATAVLVDQFWTQDSANIEDVAEADDWFGFRLSSGDYNNDTFDDLAIGVSGEDLGFGH